MLTLTAPTPAARRGMSPTLIVKPDPDADRYVLWSTIVGGPLFAGTRAQTAAELAAAWDRAYDTVPPAGHDVESRLARADHAGTSALYPAAAHCYGWHEQRFTLRRHPGAGGPLMVTRARLAEYATLITQGRTDAALSLTSAVPNRGAR